MSDAVEGSGDGRLSMLVLGVGGGAYETVKELQVVGTHLLGGETC